MTTTTPHQDNGAVLTAQAATIQTAQVAIHVLRVGKKQMTMGMFRQLPYEPIVPWWSFSWIGETAEAQLLGAPWGHVNYWWAGNERENTDYLNDGKELHPDPGERLHLVWQREGRLYRDIAFETIPQHLFGYTCPLRGDGPPPMEACRAEVEQWWSGVWQDLLALPQLYIAI
jgi:hypothetical protein